MKPLLLLTIICWAIPASAQDTFIVAWSAISSGGGSSPEPAEFNLRGSALGQLAAGDAPGEPGEFSVSGGYWTFPFEPLLPDLHLTMQIDAGTITLSWDETSLPVVLESSADLHLWTPVDPQPLLPFFQESAGARRFYRLSSP